MSVMEELQISKEESKRLAPLLERALDKSLSDEDSDKAIAEMWLEARQHFVVGEHDKPGNSERLVFFKRMSLAFLQINNSAYGATLADSRAMQIMAATYLLSACSDFDPAFMPKSVQIPEEFMKDLVERQRRKHAGDN
jgi:hypothetical protein